MEKKLEPKAQFKDRRQLLNSISLLGAGLAMPSKWTAPVISAVILPAHAQTSEEIMEPETAPIVAVLSGVVDGQISTEFTVEGDQSSGPAGSTLSFQFEVSGNCEILSQSGSRALIERGLVVGDCEVTLTVSDGSSSDSVTETVMVTGGPPGTPSG